MSAASPRLLRVPPYERGITLGDFVVPIRVGERTSVRQRNVALVLLGVLVLIASAQVVIPIPGTPVPVSGQTFGVLTVATALGFRRGLSSIALYLVLGLVLPVYAGGASGVARIASLQDGHLVLGATGGYLLGFVLAGALVGRLAELGWDRHLGGSIAAMLIGSVVIYTVGLPWLAAAASLGPADAVAQGLTPFVLGDILKIAAAAGIFPFAWWVVDHRPHER